MRRGECIGRETWVNINRVEEDRILQTRVREIRGMVAKERDNSQMRTHTCKSKM
jgi:methionine synthase II (cobalamin-independent)